MNACWIRTLIVMSAVVLSSGAIRAASFDNLPLSQTPIRFAIIGDRTSEANPGIYEEIVGEVEDMRPDFVMTVGDAIQGYTDDTLKLNSEWDEYFSIIKPLTMPIYLTPGNHDITSNAALGPYQNKVGKPYYSFDVRNFHFVVLDVTRWRSSEELPADELAWLANDLAEHRDAAQTLVFYHKPFWYDSIILGKPDTLHSLFKAYGVDAVFNGHLHSYFSAKVDGILYTALGSSGGIIDALPSDLGYHFTWVTVDDKGISIAPVKKGSVKPWDIVTATDEHTLDNIIQFSTKFSEKARVNGDLKIPQGTASIELDNVSSQPLADTIRWEIPKGWTVQPAAQFLTVNPGEKKQFSFQVTSNGELYPVPVASVKFPIAENKSVTITKDLKLSRNAFAAKAAKSPVIDGNLNDKCWIDPVVTLFGPDGAVAAIESTQFYFAYDNDNLYLAAHCYESKMNTLQAKARERDRGVSSEDCVGFFLQPDPQIDTAYQIYFNPVGTILDQEIARGSLGYFGGERSWNGSYTVKSKKGKDYWNIEVSIPLKQLNAAAGPGKEWGLNFLRKQKRLNSSANWQIPVDYDPQTFGTLDFK